MDWKKIGKQLLFPPVWLLAVLTPVSAAALAAVFLQGMEQTVMAYIVYAVAFYTLSAVTVFCVLVLPKRYGHYKEKALANPLIHRYVTDAAFRTRSGMYSSFYVNLLYVCIHLLSWYINRSWWFVVLAVYHLILAFLWALLALYVRKQPLGSDLRREWKRSRLCAFLLLSINLSLSGAVLMILYQSKGFDYPGILIYVMALFTFYSLICAIIDIIKYRAFTSPVMSAAKAVSLSAALVSLLNLETAMFAQFGAEMAPEDQRLFIILTGAGVSIIVVALSVLLIVKANKQIRRNRNGK